MKNQENKQKIKKKKKLENEGIQQNFTKDQDMILNLTQNAKKHWTKKFELEIPLKKVTCQKSNQKEVNVIENKQKF